MRPAIALTMGDPAGIGPEIALKAWRHPELHTQARPVVVGHSEVLRRCAAALGLSLPIRVVEAVPEETSDAELLVLPVAGEGAAIEPGVVSAEAGRIAAACVARACELAKAGQVQAITTGPIQKEALRAAGVAQIGHTELLADAFGVRNPLTLFLTGSLRIFFLSRHLSLRAAIDYLTVDRVVAFAVQVHEAMERLGFRAPRLALAALNPHGSDGGQFGDEEARILEPAAEEARARGVALSSPIGADSVFHLAASGRFDAVLSLYHDQGHIAAKTRDFYGTVTATLGLPVLRTSVDHGTAHDIAWQGVANEISLVKAVEAAVSLLGA